MNPTENILCPEVRESHSLYIPIYIFCFVVSSEVAFFTTTNTKIFQTDLFDPSTGP